MGHTGRYIWALAAAPAPSEIAQVLDHCRLAFAIQADDAASCGCAVKSSIMELLYHTRCACTTRRHQHALAVQAARTAVCTMPYATLDSAWRAQQGTVTGAQVQYLHHKRHKAHLMPSGGIAAASSIRTAPVCARAEQLCCSQHKASDGC